MISKRHLKREEREKVTFREKQKERRERKSWNRKKMKAVTAMDISAH
jgi:hypothetical protein